MVAVHRTGFGAIDDDRKAMGEPGRPTAPVVLTFDERNQLEDWATRPPEDAPSLTLHSSIVLQCADGSTNRDVAHDLGISERTVYKWRGRFVARRLEGLHDQARPGLPRSITDDRVDSLILATLQGRPDGTPWTRQSMAKFMEDISESSVGRIWKEHGLNPHRVNIVALCSDPKFVGKVRDVVGLYLQPPQVAFVLCVDETVPIPTARRATPMVLGPEMAQGRGGQPSATTELYGALEAASQQAIADPALATTIKRDRDLQFQRF